MAQTQKNERTTTAKAICLFSGGLDSVLAVKLMLDQGVQPILLHFVNPFDDLDSVETGRAAQAADQLSLPLRIEYKGEDFNTVLQYPKHGYGTEVNPCIDCRIYILQAAKRIMQEENADFIVTGEVLGQRPMSQLKNQIHLIEREAEVTDILLRPLSAKLLPETQPEREGLIDREKLLDIQGRSRQRQLVMAKEYGLVGIQSGGPGCVLTDPSYAMRVRDLYERKEHVTRHDFQRLRIGRHFRFDSECKLIAGRDDKENTRLMELAETEHVLIMPENFNGPVILMEGSDNPRNRRRAKKLLCAYTKPKAEFDLEALQVSVTITGQKPEFWTFSWEPIEKKELDPCKLQR